MDNLGKRIKDLLKTNGITQKDLAERTGCTQAAISHYIKGDRTPRARVMTKIASALNTTSDYLIDGIPQDQKSELGYAKKLIARNAKNMTKKEKMDLINILLGEKDD
ncbi:hypothetical protein AYP97_08045 [Lactobacillus crispatus]|jgi:transcriptional regulator with XRE-family HTH domain|uniref:Uncharacterized protein n=1 Tax=Lactobacillus crispatus TaxID=47770 RepID=A0A226UWI5_9LACO|nr:MULTISPECIES: helix-turn-helix transcriptional regulator [Lactobacillus]MBE5058129.1 helix-turn-helix transcriptional regulator [Lactobacillus crispatus]NME25807.1 helix-turn-helix transcriptional regulator [Lactobacillus crispatus]OXC13776.1 hypothetical protein AYP77_09020 [Lactobacillus crispatus]OXC19512.1 hypothetical protein AYP81_08340 [Lactobacillus crispatus]OXC22954.1 hypothetical protein AYP82_08520 [Lactobacillus crispatus]